MENNPQTQFTIAVAQEQFSVVPGGLLEIPVLLEHQGSAPEQVRITADGIPLVWVSVEQQVIVLQPGEKRQIFVNVQPPSQPNAPTGRYNLTLYAVSAIDPARVAQTQTSITVAGFEVRGRVGVLLDGLNYHVEPGRQLTIPVVLINQGLGADTFHLELKGLPENWATIPTPSVRLDPGETRNLLLVVQPPRQPDTRAGRYTFNILVHSREAPDQTAKIDCLLTVSAFTEFRSSLEPAQVDQNLPPRVQVHNLSNIPASFIVSWKSQEDALLFDPPGPVQLNLPSNEAAEAPYNARPANPPLVGNERPYPYTVAVQTPGGGAEAQILESSWMARGLLPVWAAAVGGILLFGLCLIMVWSFLPGVFPSRQQATSTPTLTIPTATLSPIDQRPLLIERNWFLVAMNDTSSTPGAQEPFARFNPDGSLIGFTGCKDMNAVYQTEFNRITVGSINLGSGACPNTALQQQEDSFVNILRSARSFFVAHSALQIAGEGGFLNFSSNPVSRPDATTVPPVAAMQVVPQAQVGQSIVFDGTTSSGPYPIVSWRWDFGDGIAASGSVVQHVYSVAGTFMIRLQVQDQRGQVGIVTQQIHVLAGPTPTATAVPPTAVPPTALPPTAVPPTDTPVPPPPPEQPTATPEPPPPPTEPPPPPEEPTPVPVGPEARVTGPTNGFIGEPVVFDGSSTVAGSSPIASFQWNFGNGVITPLLPDSSVKTIYSRPGDYEVSMFVTDVLGLSSFAITRINIDARLDTDVWTLSTIGSQPLYPGTAITIQFLEGEVVGFAGCNTYEGRYTATDNLDGTYAIQVTRLDVTRLVCPQGIMQQETDFLEALQQTTLARINENELRLVSTPALPELLFYMIEQP